ncbi:hypothetical protein Q6247_26580, partial [Klebsiella pneumoniae]
EHFSGLVDQLSAYESVPDPVVLCTRFVDGFRDDIRAVVLLHRPVDLDTACTLALLQEEVAEPVKQKEFSKRDPKYWSKPAVKG